MAGRRFPIQVVASFVAIVLVLAFSDSAIAAKYNRKVDVGQAAPKFEGLMGVDGKSHSLDDYKSAKVLVIAFTCNHCPVAQMYEDRFIRFARAQKRRGVVFVAISSSLLPPDSLDKMKERATRRDSTFPISATRRKT